MEEAMKITQITTLRSDTYPNLLWLEILSDAGISGLGETFFLPHSVEACIHEHIAPRVLGREPRDIDALRFSVTPYVGYSGSGVETRALSALDIALWDLCAKAVGLPLARMLGGFARESIRTYNTCAGPGYMRGNQGQITHNYGASADARLAKLDDYNAFMRDAGELAKDLLAEGITGMKVWPFDAAAESSGGQYIAASALQHGVSVIEKIRHAVGERMDVMLELHGLWQLTPAIRIARALKDYNLFWIEDPLKPQDTESLRRFAERSPAPLCASETLAGVHGYRALMQQQALGYVMPDLSWCGGITEALRIAALAQAWQLSVAPHDCTGPVVLAASTHLALHLPNAVLQESVRAYLRTWYGEIAEGLPTVDNGMIRPTDVAGHGVRLSRDFLQRHKPHQRTSKV